MAPLEQEADAPLFLNHISASLKLCTAVIMNLKSFDLYRKRAY